MAGRSGMGELEHLVLLVILRLEDGAYGADIARELDRAIGRSVTRGALYSTLNRLEDKGMLSWVSEEPGEAGSGHVRRRFSVTGAGLSMLRARRAALRALWSGVESVLDGSNP